MENAAGGGLLPQLRLDDLLSELQTRLDAVRGTRDRMHGLVEAVVAIGSGLELEAMLHRVVAAAVDLVEARYGALGVISEGADLVTLALPDEGGRRLTLEYAEGDGAAEARGLVVPAGRSLSGQVLESGTRSRWTTSRPIRAREAPGENEAEPRGEPPGKYPLPLRRASFAQGIPYRGASPNTRAA